MREVFAACGQGCYIELPFRANWGGRHVHFGNRVYANFDLTLVDDGGIFVGDDVLLGPNVTVDHPLDPGLRSRPSSTIEMSISAIASGSGPGPSFCPGRTSAATPSSARDASSPGTFPPAFSPQATPAGCSGPLARTTGSTSSALKKLTGKTSEPRTPTISPAGFPPATAAAAGRSVF